MSVEENKALVRRYFDEIDRTGDESVVDHYVSADFVDHSPSLGRTPDLEGLKAAFRMFRTGSPGTHRIEDIVAEGDKVVVRVTGQGVHSGELFGIPATQREFTATGITIFRVADGMIVERWAVGHVFGHAFFVERPDHASADSSCSRIASASSHTFSRDIRPSRTSTTWRIRKLTRPRLPSTPTRTPSNMPVQTASSTR